MRVNLPELCICRGSGYGARPYSSCCNILLVRHFESRWPLMVDTGSNAPSMTIKQAISYINTRNLVPFSCPERMSLAFGKWNSIETITALRLPFDPWSLGLCYLVCTERNISFILAKTAAKMDANQSDRENLLVFAGEYDGAGWRQLASVATLPEVDSVICDLYAAFPKRLGAPPDGAI